MKRSVIVRHPGEGQHLSVVGDLYRVLAWGSETAGKYALVQATIPPGGGPPPHIHRVDEEAFYIESGTLTLFVEGQPVQAGPGTFVSVPAGTVHNFQNLGDEPVLALITVAPSGLEEMFREVGTAREPGEPPIAPTPQDIEKLLAAAPRYGVEILPPA